MNKIIYFLQKMNHILRHLYRNSTLPKMTRRGYRVKPGITTRIPVPEIIRSTTIRSSSTTVIEESFIKKFMKKVGWMDQSRTVLKLAGYFLYGSVADNVSYNEWFEKCDLPDTFSSWFIVTELHVWMLMVRCMAEDLITSSTNKYVNSPEKKYVKGSGLFIRNCVVEALWADVANRIKLLEGANSTKAKKQVSELSEQFQAALIGYDEGLEDDRALAGAVWRRFYAMSPSTTAMQIECVVSFIRHQMSLLEKISKDELYSQSKISWLRISDYQVN